MTPKISVVIPVAGNDPLRSRNFDHCIKSLQSQDFKEFEIIVVEQDISGLYFKKFVEELGFRWIGIKDPLNRGFNLSWCRNVGAKESLGEKIVLMDADMSFESGYLSAVMKNTSMFAGGASLYHWINKEEVTRVFDANRNFKYIYNFGNGEPKDPVFRFSPFTRGCGYGAVLVFNREWFCETFGGYPEDFYRYGYEDKAAIEIIKELLAIENDEDLSKIDYQIVHLSHFNKDVANMKINERLFNTIKSMNKIELSARLKSLNLGDSAGPKNFR